MPNVTIVIPIGAGHEGIAERAIASARNQTVATEVVTVYDKERRGAGWARNRGVEQVNSEWVVFLDADDFLEPTFVEHTLSASRTGRYVYTGWFEDNNAKEPPEKAWCGGTWHVITSLLPTQLVREVGGFDESMPGAEDTDFYLKVVTRRVCGIRITYPLMHYTNMPDARSKIFKSSPEYDVVMQEMTRRYSGRMGCCGDIQANDAPVGEKQQGDVLAMALWGGNRREVGRATGRHYPRTGNNKLVWVDPRDIDKSPQLWQQVIEQTVDDMTVQGVVGIAGVFMQQVVPYGTPVPQPYQGVIQYQRMELPAPSTPAVSRVIELYKGATK